MQSTIRPLVKNKGGDLTDPNNYRAIALANMETKILESILMDKLHSYDDCDKYQYGIKKGHSTAMCTSAVKKVTDDYINRGSHVFLSFVDFSKAFDRVNYWKLFSQLLDDGIELCFVKLLAFWYSNQTACVLWQNTVSHYFLIGNGTRQGGILSPYLFTDMSVVSFSPSVHAG